MKFPKLKHSVLCQLILYFPAFAFFLYLIVLGFIDDGGPVTGLRAIGLLASAAFSLWYLFANILVFMFSDPLFAAIRSWKRDRLEYRSFRNGRSREAVERHILRRCRLWGRRYAPQRADAARFQMFYRHGLSWTVHYSVIEKRVAVCSVEHLTVESYRLLVGKARVLLRQIPDGKPRFKTKKEKKAPRARLFAVIILADRVDAEVRALARKVEKLGDNDCVFPCVAECPGGAYYMDGSRDCFMMGMTPRPVKNYASALVQRLVFGGRLPKEDRTKRPPCELADQMEQSLWEFWREFRREMRLNKTGEEKEQKKMLRRLHDGEVCIGEYAIYCKVGERLAQCAYLPDENDETLLSLLPDDHWYFHTKKQTLFINRRKMKQADMEAVKRRIETQLRTEGYRIQP